MKVARKKPRAPWELVEIENTLEALQAEVGGYIETVTFTSDTCLIVNEEGIINDLPFNLNFAGLQLFGTVLWVGVNEEDGEFCDVPLTDKDLKHLPD